MKLEDYNLKTAEILQNLSDQAKVSTLLSELKEDYEKEQADKTTALSTAEKLVADNEKLRSANMSLFLKIGDSAKEEPQKQSLDTTPKFDSLFDENGNLK